MKEVIYKCSICSNDLIENKNTGEFYCKTCDITYWRENIACRFCSSQTIMINSNYTICTNPKCLLSRVIRCQVKCRNRNKCNKKLYDINRLKFAIESKVALINFDRSCLILNNTNNSKKPYMKFTTSKNELTVKTYLEIRKFMLGNKL